MFQITTVYFVVLACDSKLFLVFQAKSHEPYVVYNKPTGLIQISSSRQVLQPLLDVAGASGGALRAPSP